MNNGIRKRSMEGKKEMQLIEKELEQRS